MEKKIYLLTEGIKLDILSDEIEMPICICMNLEDAKWYVEKDYFFNHWDTVENGVHRAVLKLEDKEYRIKEMTLYLKED